MSWMAVWLVVAVGETIAVRTLPGAWEQPTFLFWLVLIAASLCVVSSGAVIVRGWRSGVAETAMIGSLFMAVSLSPLAHGLTVPGILYGPNTATMATVFWAVPLGSIVLGPLLGVRSRACNSLMGFWRYWVAGHLVILALTFAVALAAPNLIPVPTMGGIGAAAGVWFALVFCVALSVSDVRAFKRWKSI